MATHTHAESHAHADHEHDENCDHDHDHDHDHGHAHGEGRLPVTATVEDLGPCKKLLRVELGADVVKRELDHRLERLRRTVHLKGFRKGKAPLARIQRLYGDAVLEDAREQLLRQGYMSGVEQGLGADKVLGEGTIEKVEFSREEGLKFEVTLHVRPELNLPEYKGREVKVPAVKVEEKDIDQAIDRMRKSRGEMRPVEGEGAVVEGEDLLSVDVQVWLADEYETWSQAQEKGETPTTEVKPLKEEFGLEVQLPADYLGSYEVEDLADSLTGLKIGEWGDAETDLPDDFEVVEGRGEPAVLRIRIEAIRRMILPELTEEWVKQAGHESIADLRREVREGLQQHLEVARRYQIEQRIVDRLLEDAGNFDLPTDLMEKEIETAERRRQLEQRLQGKSEQEAQDAVAEERDQIRQEVEKMLRSFFLVDEIARREKLGVNERDVEARIARIAAQRGEAPRAVREQLERHRVLPQLRQEIMDEKVRSLLREHAQISEVQDD